MTWGRARTLTTVHFFDESGKSLCRGAANGNHLTLLCVHPEWDPSHEKTCQKCLDEFHDMKVLERLREDSK